MSTTIYPIVDEATQETQTRSEWRVESMLWRRHLSGYMGRNNFNTLVHHKIVQQVFSTHPKKGLLNASQTLARAPQSMKTQPTICKPKPTRKESHQAL
jgi:hypothetical protein